VVKHYAAADGTFFKGIKAETRCGITQLSRATNLPPSARSGNLTLAALRGEGAK
jgi:hypothetical protein